MSDESFGPRPGDIIVQQRKTTPDPDPRPPMAGIVCAASIKPEPFRWLWEGWLAAGKLAILAGAPGTGKTTVAITFAATISSGGRWPDGTKAAPGTVLIWSSEDDVKDTLVPRLIANGANLENVHFIETAMDGERSRSFDPSTDIDQLHAAIRERKIHPDLLIVDPVVSAVGGDSHKNTETRRCLQPLVDLGIAEDCAILGISHFSKGSAGRDVTERVTGSLAFGALARVVIAAAKMPDDQGGGRFIARAKSNISIDAGGFNYRIEQTPLPDHPGVSGSRVHWGDAIEGTAREILAQAEVTQDQDTQTQTDEAADWLMDILRDNDGRVTARDATKRAKGDAISEKALRNAASRLKLQKSKGGFKEGWTWTLPHAEGAQLAEDAQEALSQNEGIFGGRGRLREPNGHDDADSEKF